MHRYWIVAGLALAMGSPVALADTVDSALADYRQQGAGDFSADRGAEMWRKESAQQGKARSCVTCHGGDLRQAGEHARTGKTIEPMAPSANPVRLTERREIEKWFLRNCKWTWGRECTAQEKGDFLSFLQTQ